MVTTLMLDRARLTQRQWAFLHTVMLHSGVFVARQYTAFAGITLGQKVHDFIEKLLVQRLVNPHLLKELGGGGGSRTAQIDHTNYFTPIALAQN